VFHMAVTLETLSDGFVLYDKENEQSWVQSETAVSLEDHR